VENVAVKSERFSWLERVFYPRVAIINGDNRTTLIYRWRTPGSLFIFFIDCLALSRIQELGSASVKALALLAPLTYVCFGFVINKTTFEINGLYLMATHGPLPWLPSGYTIVHADISFVYYTEDQGRKRNSSWYSIRIVLRDGTGVTVAKGIEERNTAESLVSGINALLGRT